MKAKGFDYLKKITAVDYKDYLEVVYILYNMETKEEQTIQARLPAENPEVDTVIELYKAADWYERELSEMFGIKVRGREMHRLLLEEWPGKEFPLRKSFVWGVQPYKESRFE